jgi:hypothetical protein
MGQDNLARMCDWRCSTRSTMNNIRGPRRQTHTSSPTSTPIRRARGRSLRQLPGQLPEDRQDPRAGRRLQSDPCRFATAASSRRRGDSDQNYSVAGTGNQRTIAADVDWTFPLNFVEVVWSDGKKVDRQVISATDSAPFGKAFAIPFDATGKAWVRFAVWDSAGNGAFVQPVWVSPKTGQTTSSR